MGRKFVDLTGQQFERLKVIKRVENSKKGEIQYLCKCDCDGENSEKIIRGYQMQNGSIQSCGCLQKEIMSELFKKHNTYDLSGEYGIGYTLKDKPFYFDLEDYNLIKDYCWYKDNDGYIVSKSEDEFIKMHRLVMNCPSGMDVDHIYHQTYDNRKNELRIVTRSQNSMNQIIKKNNTSGFKGICWDKENDKWLASIMLNYKNINLGRFNDINDAINVRKEAEEKYFKEHNYKEKENINI